MLRIARRLTPLVALALVATCSGCLYWPVSENKVLKGKQVTERQRQVICPAVTSRSDVISNLGPPDVEWENERVFAYRWEMRRGLLFYAIGGGYDAEAGVIEVPKGYILLVQFDHGDRVSRVEQLPDKALESFGKQVRRWAATGAATP